MASPTAAAVSQHTSPLLFPDVEAPPSNDTLMLTAVRFMHELLADSELDLPRDFPHREMFVTSLVTFTIDDWSRIFTKWNEKGHNTNQITLPQFISSTMSFSLALYAHERDEIRQLGQQNPSIPTAVDILDAFLNQQMHPKYHSEARVEYFARQIAYSFDAEEPARIIGRVIPVRTNSGDLALYRIANCLNPGDGLVAYVVLPYYSPDGQPLPAQFVFRGTHDWASAVRDTQALCPGFKEFQAHRQELLDMFLRAQRAVRNPHWELSGHSLGCCDNQLFVAELVNCEEITSLGLERVEAYFFNSPGVHRDANDRFFEGWHARCAATGAPPFTLRFTYVRIEKDIVQTVGGTTVVGKGKRFNALTDQNRFHLRLIQTPWAPPTEPLSRLRWFFSPHSQTAFHPDNPEIKEMEDPSKELGRKFISIAANKVGECVGNLFKAGKAFPPPPPAQLFAAREFFAGFDGGKTRAVILAAHEHFKQRSPNQESLLSSSRGGGGAPLPVEDVEAYLSGLGDSVAPAELASLRQAINSRNLEDFDWEVVELEERESSPPLMAPPPPPYNASLLQQPPLSTTSLASRGPGAVSLVDSQVMASGYYDRRDQLLSHPPEERERARSRSLDDVSPSHARGSSSIADVLTLAPLPPTVVTMSLDVPASAGNASRIHLRAFSDAMALSLSSSPRDSVDATSVPPDGSAVTVPSPVPAAPPLFSTLVSTNVQASMAPPPPSDASTESTVPVAAAATTSTSPAAPPPAFAPTGGLAPVAPPPPEDPSFEAPPQRWHQKLLGGVKAFFSGVASFFSWPFRKLWHLWKDRAGESAGG